MSQDCLERLHISPSSPGPEGVRFSYANNNPRKGYRMKSIHDSHYIGLVATLKSRRVALGLNQSAVASKLGRSNRWVSKVERRDIRLDVMTFIRVCRALGVRASRLIQKVEEELDDSGSSLAIALRYVMGFMGWMGISIIVSLFVRPNLFTQQGPAFLLVSLPRSPVEPTMLEPHRRLCSFTGQ